MAYAGQFQLENLLGPGIKGQTIGSNLPEIDFSGVGKFDLPSNSNVGSSSTTLGQLINASSGAITPANGITQPGQPWTLNWTGATPPILNSNGVNTLFKGKFNVNYAATFVPFSSTVTGAQVLVGATGGTDNWLAGIANASGLVLGFSLATTAGTASGMQQFPFTQPLALQGPNTYYLFLQSSGTTATFQTHGIQNNMFPTGTLSTASGVLSATQLFTPNLGYTVAQGPIMSTY